MKPNLEKYQRHRDACSKVLQKRTDRDAESKECKEKEREMERVTRLFGNEAFTI